MDFLFVLVLALAAGHFLIVLWGGVFIISTLVHLLFPKTNFLMTLSAVIVISYVFCRFFEFMNAVWAIMAISVCASGFAISFAKWFHYISKKRINDINVEE